MKKILLSAVMVFAGAALWAQAITGNAAFDAKIKAESQKLDDGGYVMIDEATETILERDDDELEVETKIWPKNKLTENMVLPKFFNKDEVNAAVYMTTKLELTWFFAYVSKCERADFEKYVEELKAAGWNKGFKFAGYIIDALLSQGENVWVFNAQNESGLKMLLSYDKRDNWVKVEIDSRDEE